MSTNHRDIQGYYETFVLRHEAWTEVGVCHLCKDIVVCLRHVTGVDDIYGRLDLDI